MLRKLLAFVWRQLTRHKVSSAPAAESEITSSNGGSAQAGVHMLSWGPTQEVVRAVPLDELIASEEPLINEMRKVLDLSCEEFDDYVLPVIKNYAAYVHLLPASKEHHHCNYGGLFRHGLEVAYYCAEECKSTTFGHRWQPPLDEDGRKVYKRPWHVCTVIAGLLHDIGKAYVDLGARDETGKLKWSPGVRPLLDWLTLNKLPYYVVYWKPGARHKRHERLTPFAAAGMVPNKTLCWLFEKQDFRAQGEHAVDAMEASLCDDSDPKNQIAKVVRRADGLSVATNLKEFGAHYAETHSRRNIFGRLLHAVHEQLDSGKWRLNEPGQPIWITKQGVFALHPAFAEGVAKAMRDDDDQLPVLPDVESIVSILDDYGQLERNICAEGDFAEWIIKITTQSNGEEVTSPAMRYIRFTDGNLIISPLTIRPKPVHAEIVKESSSART